MALDPEQQTGLLVSLLSDYLGPDGDARAPPGLDREIVSGLQAVLTMGHNRPLARRVHAEARRMATAGGLAPAETSAARRAQATVELVYKVIVGQGQVAGYDALEPLGPLGRQALLSAINAVGVYARADPFPEFDRAPCERRTRCELRDGTGQPVQALDGSRHFDVLRPVRVTGPTPGAEAAGAAGPGAGGVYSGSGRCYALVRVLKKAIYGDVRLGHVVRVEQLASEGAGVVLRWTEDRVAIKCISKAAVQRMQASGSPMNENPLKEMRCLSWITRRMSGALGGPEALAGDPTRVLPMVDCLEDKTHYFMVMPCLEEEMFSVVERRSGPFPEPQCFDILRQTLDGLEVAHSLGLAHHDMSLENMMTDAQGKAVIIDWGMVVRVPLCHGRPVRLAAKASWPGKCGKLLYLAPELLDIQEEISTPFDPFKLDLWSIGVMLFILLTGVPPWDVQSGPSKSDNRFRHVVTGRLQALLNAWRLTHVSPGAVELCQAFLLEDPADRPSIGQARTFAWYRSEGGRHA